VWLLLAFLACSSRPPAPTPEPVPTVAPHPGAPIVPKTEVSVGVADEACVERCMHDSMARPVAADVIEADCRGACTPQGIVRNKDDLTLRLGQRVVAEGKYQRFLHHGHGPEPYMGTAIVLSDSTPLWISTGDAPADLQKWVDQTIRMEATLAAGSDGDLGLWLAARGAVTPVGALPAAPVEPAAP